MKTRILKATGADRPRAVKAAAQLLRRGEVVAFPTETVYGLGASIYNRRAVRTIYRVKKRPGDNPLIIHLGSIEGVHELAASIPIRFWLLAHKFMPGPLTVVLRRSPSVPSYLHPGGKTVAVRIPGNRIAREVITAAGVPLVAPSANLSGKPSPTTAGHVAEDLDGKIAMILDGGRCRIGLESTVIDLTKRSPVILRPGAVTREEIEDILRARVTVARSTRGRPASPGMKYRHYAPKAELVIVEGRRPALRKAITEMISLFGSSRKIGVLAEESVTRTFARVPVFSLGSSGAPGAASRLFDGLRTLDRKKVDLILCQGFEEKALGSAVMNRLKKAASRRVKV